MWHSRLILALYAQTWHFIDLVQEEALVGMLKEMVKSEINSLIC
jgi:hypothetical protein